MKPIVIAPVAILLLAPRLARAQDVHVYKDQQGVQTYTNVPASRRPAKLPRKDEDGALVYSNLPASGVRKPSAEPEPTEESPAFTVVPASPLQEPLQEPPPPPNYGAQGTPSGSGAGSMPASGSDGQWVYTDQYGWVWMPYGARYVSEGSPGDAAPYAYVYDPSDGWGWVSAPWVWGWGAYPYFGALGPGRFGWYTGLMHAGYGWGGYRGGGPGRVGFARSFSVGHRAGGFTGRGFAGGARFRSGGGGHFGAPAAHARFSGGGGFRGGGGFSGGHGGGGFGGGGHAGGGHGGGGRR